MRMPDKKKVVKFIPIPLYYRRKLFYEQVTKDDGKLAWVLKDDDLSRTFYKNMTYRQSAILADVYKNVYQSLKLADRIKVDSWMNGRNMNDLATYSVFFKDCYFDCDLTDIGVEEAIEIRLSQDFTRCDVNGNLPNEPLVVNGYRGFGGLWYIDQYRKEEWNHFDDVLKVFEPYMEDRHKKFNETFNKRDELTKIHKK